MGPQGVGSQQEASGAARAVSAMSVEEPILFKEQGRSTCGGDAPRRLWAAIALAQFLSLCLAVTGISSATLASSGINLPTSQSVLNYGLLAVTFGGWRIYRGGRLVRPWWCYAVLALVDVEANFLVVKAYQYTSLTSVTLLDCFTIPAVIALSFFILGSRYRPRHYAAAALCVAGLALLVASEGRSSTAGQAPLLGDALVVAGALLYSISNVTQELFLSGTSPAELLGMVGAFGFIIAAIQASIIERDAWAQLLLPTSSRPGAGDTRYPLAGIGMGNNSSDLGGGSGTFNSSSGGGGSGADAARVAVAPALSEVAAAFAAFTAALYSFSALVPVVLVWGGATALNLSLLTSDLWAAAARVALFGGFGGGEGWFAGSLVLVAAGLSLYASAGSTKVPGCESNRSGEVLSGSGAASGGGGGAGFDLCLTCDDEEQVGLQQQRQQQLGQQQQQGGGEGVLLRWQRQASGPSLPLSPAASDGGGLRPAGLHGRLAGAVGKLLAAGRSALGGRRGSGGGWGPSVGEAGVGQGVEYEHILLMRESSEGGR